MIEARKNIAGLDDFTKRVNSLDSDLYSILDAEPYVEKRYIHLTRYIIEKFYDGDQNKAIDTIAEQDSVRLIAA